ncbi:PAS domain S-box-containing protein [Parasphingorhabdus marina DSM 22363]|uniref:histidine kinase n=1 Tax=Parasphingorhabdus marina DSM 22363 TaxID=1123272 RepID=A0A1N6CM90_9SPHN|nr:PAS domain-containing hybrid sensor histidine kinase/response regulator [Parasphingorhabdus marina]SIN59690.1 PAS domain S-box-containing protein [Parasphingorhabdus marina DSM 22363]
MTLWLAIAIALIYSAGLFALAVAGDRGRIRLNETRSALVYGLSLAVYATSWTFYGAVGTAVTGGLEFLPIYLGPILLFTLGYPIVRKTLRLGKAMHSTSIADFLSTRYGKSGSVAALVTVIATIGLLPYVALQLKSVAQTLTELSPDIRQNIGTSDVVLAVAGIMALFAILFGTRSVDLTRHNRGLVLTIAAEAIVKLFALMIMAGFAIWLIWNIEPGSSAAPVNPAEIFAADQMDARFWVLTLIAFCAALCLPRQFHMTVVEATVDKPGRLMQWTFPIYLAITTLAVFPITMAGLAYLDGARSAPDMIMLALPLAQGLDWLAIAVFIGGFSAATGMIIVTTIALSAMITNDLVVPVVYRLRQGTGDSTLTMGQQLLWVRRSVVLGFLALAYLYYRTIDNSATLAGLGTISFAAVAQFAPGLIAGLYWKSANRNGMMAGLSAGFASWFLLLIVPAYLGGDPLIAISGDPLVSGVIISLVANISLFALVSVATRPNLVDQAQAASFVALDRELPQDKIGTSGKRVADFRLLLEQFVGSDNARATLTALRQTTGKGYNDLDRADAALVEMSERQLSGILGASSARSLIISTLEGDAVPLEEVVAMFDETSQRLQFSGELLQTAIENIDQGVAVVDQDMRLVAWNSRYVEMFGLPEELVIVGQPIGDLIAHNLGRTEPDGNLVAEEVEKRLGHMRAGRRHALEREQPDGRVLRIMGNPTPQQGYVTSYTDITADRRQEQALETMVEERTRQLTEANAALEKATRSKTRFLAAASHDLVQPMNAARLFTSALSEEIDDGNETSRQLVSQIDHSIEMADKLLRTLLDISKLDGGGLKPNPVTFSVQELFDDLRTQFEGRAADERLDLRVVGSSTWISADKGMLASIMQNLISNALRYTEQGRVLLGARRRGQKIELQVWDSGPGISQDDLESVFEEFRQLRSHSNSEGVGLGLALAQRLARLLGSEIQLVSTPDKGSCFSLTLPETAPETEPARPVAVPATPSGSFDDLEILCIDNEPKALEALSGLLTRWGCEVATATRLDEVETGCPDLLILDYQLDNDVTGDEIYAGLTERWGKKPPVILLTAEDTDATLALCRNLGFERLLKPASPMALRALMGSLVRPSSKKEKTADAAS